MCKNTFIQHLPASFESTFLMFCVQDKFPSFNPSTEHNYILIQVTKSTQSSHYHHRCVSTSHTHTSCSLAMSIEYVISFYFPFLLTDGVLLQKHMRLFNLIPPEVVVMLGSDETVIHRDCQPQRLPAWLPACLVNPHIFHPPTHPTFFAERKTCPILIGEWLIKIDISFCPFLLNVRVNYRQCLISLQLYFVLVCTDCITGT